MGTQWEKEEEEEERRAADEHVDCKIRRTLCNSREWEYMVERGTWIERECYKDSAGRFLLAIRTSFSDETSEIGPGGVRSPVEKKRRGRKITVETVEARIRMEGRMKGRKNGRGEQRNKKKKKEKRKRKRERDYWLHRSDHCAASPSSRVTSNLTGSGHRRDDDLRND